MVVNPHGPWTTASYLWPGPKMSRPRVVPSLSACDDPQPLQEGHLLSLAFLRSRTMGIVQEASIQSQLIYGVRRGFAEGVENRGENQVNRVHQ
jgi:hypothetical protein